MIVGCTSQGEWRVVSGDYINVASEEESSEEVTRQVKRRTTAPLFTACTRPSRVRLRR
jgi:hypothetical protein